MERLVTSSVMERVNSFLGFSDHKFSYTARTSPGCTSLEPRPYLPPQMRQSSNSVPLTAATMSRYKGSPSPPGSLVLSRTAIFFTVLGRTLKRYLLDQGL